MKRELIVFLITFLLLATVAHFDAWTSYPINHLLSLPSSGAYGLGMIHPLIFTTIVYLMIMPFRWMMKAFFHIKIK